MNKPRTPDTSVFEWLRCCACDIHPDSNIELEKQWTPAGYSWYGDELIPNKPSRYTPEQQIEILDTHPFFTGVCPNCQHQFERANIRIIHFDCPSCGWTDDVRLV